MPRFDASLRDGLEWLNPRMVNRPRVNTLSGTKMSSTLKTPKVILLDTTDSPHFSDLSSCTNDLDADVSPWLDDSVFVISELRGGGIGIPLDITGDQMGRYEEAQRPSLGEEALWVDGVDNSVHRLPLEWPPNDSTVSNGKLGQASPGKNAPLGNIECVHDGDDVVAPGAGSLDVLEQLARHKLVHVAAKVRWVQGDPALHVVEEKHDARRNGDA